MGESRPANPPADTPRTELTPVQQTYSDYVSHAVGCDSCRSVDGESCGEGDVLFEAYRQLKRGQCATEAINPR